MLNLALVSDGDADDALRRELFTAWVEAPGRQRALALKQAAKEEFGLSGVVYNPRGYRNPTRQQIERARRAVRLMYRETQEALQERGITEVRLFRGVREPYRDIGALEAWSPDFEVAAQFAGPTGIGLEQVVPAARILAWYDGPGWVMGPKGQQYEWTVLSEEPQ